MINRSRLVRLTHRNGAAREEAFCSLMAERGVALSRNSRRFRFGLTSYTPDYFDPATGIYYEVIGSRQRFSTLAPKLDLMAHVLSDICLHVVKPDGQPYMRKRNRGTAWEAIRTRRAERRQEKAGLA